MIASVQNHAGAAESESEPVATITPSSSGTFHSILFDAPATARANLAIEPPECFHDLALDQIVDGILAGRQDYNLAPFFYTRLTDGGAIAYRHEVMRDLDNEKLYERAKHSPHAHDDYRPRDSTIACVRHPAYLPFLVERASKEASLEILHAIESIASPESRRR